MTLRGLSNLLLIAGALAGLGVLLAGVLAWRLVELRAVTAAALRDCTCCDDPDRMDR
jgi:hypothetical protein